MPSPFPLPLTPIEEFFLLDDQPGYPNHIVCRLRFEGEFDPDIIEQTRLESLERHPMLAASVMRRGGRRFWKLDDPYGPQVHWVDADDQTDYPELEPLDPHVDPSSRFVITRRNGAADILFQVHHAAMDGVGGLQAIADWMVMYHRLWTGDLNNRKLKLPRLDDQLLRDRGRLTKNRWTTLRQLPNQAIGAYGMAKYLSRRPTPLDPRAETPAQLPSRWAPSVLTHQFSQPESAKMQAVARQGEATVNGLLARDLFLALNRWQADHGIAPGDRCLRLMIPLNMRTFADRRMCAANRVSMVYLDRFRRELRDARGLLWGVNFEMRTIRRLNLGTTCLIMLGMLQRIHGGLRRQVAADVCRATSLLTNLAAPFARLPLPQEDGQVRVGNLRLSQFDMLAPLRPQTSTSFCVFRYGGRTGISMNYDPWTLTVEGARKLLDLFVARVCESIGQFDGDGETSGTRNS